MKNPWRMGALALLVLVMGACGTVGYKDSKINELCLVYSGGVWEDASYQGLMKPGSNNYSTGVGSTAYCYRNDQRSFIAAAGETQKDTGPAEVVSADQTRLQVEYQLYFTLNQDEEVLREFHENLGVKTEAWKSDGWTQLLEEYFQPQIDRALDRVALQYDWRDLYSSADVRAEFQHRTVTALKENIQQVIGGDYFCGPEYDGSPDSDCGDFTFTIGTPRPTNGDIIHAVEAEQTAAAAAVAQEQENARIEAQIRGEEAIVELYGPEGALLLKAIESGNVQFMVIPDSGTISIPTPSLEDQE